MSTTVIETAGGRRPAGAPRRITNAIRTIFIRLPQVERVTRRVEQLFHHRCSSEEPEHLILLGEPGVGKSTLLRRYAETHARVEHVEVTEIPVLYVSVPAACSIKKLAGVLLLAMKSPFWNRGSEADRTHQLMTLLRACRVRLVILDEVNHLLDRGAAKTHYAVGDWVKQISDEAGVSFVLAGTPVTERLMWTNEQLRSRFSEVICLSPLGLGTAAEAATFEGALKTYQALLTGIDAVNLTSASMLKHLAIATGGRLRAMRRLLVRAVELAQAQVQPELGVDILGQAFREVIFDRAPDARNPFSKAFDGRPLSAPGEPYGPERK